MCKEEEKQKSIDTEEYEYGDMDLEFEEEDEDEDEYDAMYMDLEEEIIENFDTEDFEQVEELKPLRVSSWIHPKSGKTRNGIEVVTRKDDAQVDFDDYANLCLAPRMKLNPNRQTRIPKRTQEPDVCSICYAAWTSQGSHRICCLPCGHVYGMSCIRKWYEIASCGAMCPQCNQDYDWGEMRPIYATRICNLAADQKAPVRRFSFSRLGYTAFKRYELSRRNYAWDKRSEALKRQADVVRRFTHAIKRRSELLNRRANVLKRSKALEHRDNALRRANSLRLRADALGRRAEEYIRSAKTFKLRAQALNEKARAFNLQVKAFKPRLKFFEDSHNEFHGLA